MKTLWILICTGLVLMGIVNCAPNMPWRTDIEPRLCDETDPGSCATTIWEKHNGYELAFIEFTERGNVFSNIYEEAVLNRLWRYARDQEPLAIMVFVHGWKHNANAQDGNVISFRKALKALSESGTLGAHKLIGLYIGWRGLSMHGLYTENLTYWDRKAVAQEVGKGGVTEVFVELDKIDRYSPSNYLFIIGHSFGGAITLSALNELFLERLKTAQEKTSTPLKAFGEGTVIINPAIEANQILQLKEASMLQGGENPDQPVLLHVLSSQGDAATHTVFPIGQALGVGLTWNQQDIQRRYGDRAYVFSEYDLDTTTVGNFPPFHTAALLDLKGLEADERQTLLKQFKIAPGRKDVTLGQWVIHSYCTNDPSQENDREKRLPCQDNEAVTFVYTTESFIKDHNDVFNANVMAYFSTLVSQAIFKQGRSGYFPQCADGRTFFFESCFNFHYKRYLRRSSDAPRED